MTFKRKLTTAIATGAVLLNALAPLALASTTLTITGNGSDSESKVNVSTNTTTVVTQSNKADVTNNVTANQTTGNNSANDNTGGDVTVNTGAATSNVTVDNKLNSNNAQVDNCNCNSNTTVNVSGNGSESENTVNLNNGGSTQLVQDNNADVNNNVNTTQNTGSNDADRNTGGDTTVMTGNAKSDVTVNTTANANIASVGGNGGNGGSTNIIIAGNGSDSENSVKLSNDPSTYITQANDAEVNNNVKTNQTTGNNDANDNEGGDVTIDTGNSNSTVGIDNMVNFNAADVDNCGCFSDLTAKIAGNGTDSENEIGAVLGGDLMVYQGGRDGGNDAELKNIVDPKSNTGYNDSNRNSGPVGIDPVSNFTGNSSSDVSVNNTANSNVFTTGADTTGGDHQSSPLSFTFDLGSIWGFFHIG